MTELQTEVSEPENSALAEPPVAVDDPLSQAPGELSSPQEEPTAESRAPTQAPRSQRLWVFAVAGLIVLLDQVSKRFIEQWLLLGDSWAPIEELSHLFQITYTTNSGAAFGLFQNGGTLFAIIAIAVSVFIVFYNRSLPTGNMLLRTALGLQLGGALGNLIDRLSQGRVTDFLDFGPWPIFNVADMAVVTGVILMAFVLLREDRAAQNAKRIANNAPAAEPEGGESAVGLAATRAPAPTPLSNLQSPSSDDPSAS